MKDPCLRPKRSDPRVDDYKKTCKTQILNSNFHKAPLFLIWLSSPHTLVHASRPHEECGLHCRCTDLGLYAFEVNKNFVLVYLKPFSAVSKPAYNPDRVISL